MGVLGAKALRLKELQDIGMPVPSFSVVPDEPPRAGSYAVRSNASAEDSSTSSHAGQFLTKLDVAPGELEHAIAEVAASAGSVIVQEYIPADFAGVAFTRNPLGGRELIIEYHRGRGEDVVSGKIIPGRLAFNRYQALPKTEIPNFKKLVALFETIEEHYLFPQDIEWCIRGSELYILQTRPITTSTPEEYQQYVRLDQELPQFQEFLFAKTEISEIAPRPSSRLLELLKKIYGPGGPVQAVYKKYGIQYMPHDFLRLVNTELYVDREAELETLLPSYSYFPLRDQKPHFKTWSGLWITMKNIAGLDRLSLAGYDRLYQELATKLSAPLGDFMKDYEIIFEANLLAERAFKSDPSLLDQFSRLRELGRQLTQRHMEAMHIATGGEASLPVLLASSPLLHDDKKPLGVSPGRAEGELGKDILVTSLLTPDLAKQFPHIKGIVAQYGGMLSHLAILAREAHIPVVVGVNLKSLRLTLGDRVAIDGVSGTIQKLD